MGGEMIFIHEDKPISNFTLYEQLLQSILNDCKNQEVAVEYNADKPMEIFTEKEKQYLKSYYKEKLGVDDDYVVGITLQKTRNGYNEDSVRYGHFYILFPKDPNTFKIISNMHARGFGCSYDVKNWIHNWMVKFVVSFSGVFKLYYGDGYSGHDEIHINVEFSNGRDYLVEANW